MAKRKTTRKRTAKKATKKRSVAPPKPITPKIGETLWILDPPFAARSAVKYAGAQWCAARKRWVYCGASLPALLKMFLPKPLSWAAWQASSASRSDYRSYVGGEITLHPHQEIAKQLVVDSFADTRPGVLVADEVGLGKTFSVIAGVNELPDDEVRNVLVVCPLAVAPGWRKSLRQYGTGNKRWCVTNVDGLKKLLSVPQSALDAKKTKTKNKHIAEKGTSLVDWDVVVLDESHLFRNPVSQRTKAMRTLTQGTFRIWVSATAGQNPLELSYLAPILGATTGRKVEDLEQFEQWCLAEGISVSRGSYGKWEWQENDEDLEKMRAILFEPYGEAGLPAGIRRRPTDIANWPEQVRFAHPVELDEEGERLYDEAWTSFRKDMKLAAKGKDPSNGLAAQTRFRQKASMIRVPGTVELIKNMMENKKQVAVSVYWLETADVFQEELEKAKISCARIDGSLSEQQREDERERYQRGDAEVILFTVKEGINLHSSEDIANGVDRVTIIHDTRYSGLESLQIEGRSARDGTKADAYYCYAEDTVEEDVVTRAVKRLRSTKQMQGDDVQGVKELEALLSKAALAGDDPDELEYA